jgi:hypothetical protein
MKTINHAQLRNCMATTTNSYNTHDTDKYGMLRFLRKETQDEFMVFVFRDA